MGSLSYWWSNTDATSQKNASFPLAIVAQKRGKRHGVEGTKSGKTKCQHQTRMQLLIAPQFVNTNGDPISTP